MLKWFLIIILLTVPVAIWAFFKPVRVLAPELTGIFCASSHICIDDKSHVEKATYLYEEALHFIENSLASIESKPRVIFCASSACAQSFGLGKRSAITVSTFGIIVGPRAWEPHYLRHEMIHYVQFEKLGTLKAWFGSPKWLTEGMAYYLSEDPRSELAEPFESYRSEFASWYQQVGRDNLWTEADKL
ncbi:MAG: hypothetical protein HKM94_10315 [Halobacteria archaeon]|nr:hypothetical protein [Halobacteria archaeon]